MSIIEHELQLCLKQLQHWATVNGFRLSKTNLYAYLPEKRSPLDKSLIPVVEDTKFMRGYLTGGYALYPI